MLENKTKGMNSSKKGYIVNLLSDKSSEYIEENFKYVVEMFEREEQESSSKLVEEATKNSFSKNAKVPKAEILSESNKTVANNSNPVNTYLSALQDMR